MFQLSGKEMVVACNISKNPSSADTETGSLYEKPSKYTAFPTKPSTLSSRDQIHINSS
jgi:hypothetical protein